MFPHPGKTCWLCAMFRDDAELEHDGDYTFFLAHSGNIQDPVSHPFGEPVCCLTSLQKSRVVVSVKLLKQ
jgi:hypothetical protein